MYYQHMIEPQTIERVRQFCKDRDWSQFHDPKNLAISLLLESSEFLELFQWTQDNNVNPRHNDNIPRELADVLYWVIIIADHYKIDLNKALEKKMTENEAKYPIEKARGKSEKYNQL